MKHLPALLTAFALLGAALSGALYFQIGNSKKMLEGRLAAANTRAGDLSKRLAESTAQNESLEQRLTALDTDLGETKSRLTSAEARNTQLARELAQTRTVAAAREQAERRAAEENAGLIRALAEARTAAGSPETIASYKATIADLERQLANAQHGAAAPAVAGASTAVFTSPSPAPELAPPPAPQPVTATVLSVGPKSAFVVLDYGSERGATVGQRFSIQSGTTPLAVVLISDVRTAFSIAQVQPDSLQGVLHKGDSALLNP